MTGMTSPKDLRRVLPPPIRVADRVREDLTKSLDDATRTRLLTAYGGKIEYKNFNLMELDLAISLLKESGWSAEYAPYRDENDKSEVNCFYNSKHFLRLTPLEE